MGRTAFLLLDPRAPHDVTMPTPYTGALELTAPGALTLRVEFADGAPSVSVSVKALESWLTSRGVANLGAMPGIIAAMPVTSPPTDRSEHLSVKEAIVVVSKVEPGLVGEIYEEADAGRRAAIPALRELLLRAQLPAKVIAPPEAPAASLSEHMAAERQKMIEALDATRWDRGATAERMGMARRTFYRRMTEYGLLEGAKPRGIKAQKLRLLNEPKSAAKKPAAKKPVSKTGRSKHRA